ncbi:hypothetical protein Bhyg_01631 [Pseudolycoriella hygida]|uniref:Uncharacterized protein n=1 Tax=Pseudolycoriella hygida TaxID=35572 RepID=A0A9Q0S7R9_9DIPT|nr:hypothetical protein Bhyg_01631 [Pseudolycoriella hygida]
MSDGYSKKRRLKNEASQEHCGKKRRLNDTFIQNSSNPSISLETDSQLVESLNEEMSKWTIITTKRKRRRSTSTGSNERNVKARISDDLNSCNPEPTTFLTNSEANELNNLIRTASVDVMGSHILDAEAHTPPPCPEPLSTESSLDAYDLLVMQGREVLNRMLEDSFFKKFV